MGPKDGNYRVQIQDYREGDPRPPRHSTVTNRQYGRQYGAQ
jgi:hypothetical protein